MPQAHFSQIRFAVRVDESMLNIRLNDQRYAMLQPEKHLKSRVNYSPVGVMYDFVQLEVADRLTR